MSSWFPTNKRWPSRHQPGITWELMRSFGERHYAIQVHSLGDVSRASPYRRADFARQLRRARYQMQRIKEYHERNLT